jgi:hypothetical protein
VVTNNGGIDAVDAYVEVFIADPSTAFTPATAMPVGSGFLTIPNYRQVPIIFPWTPTASEAGHRCLLARVCLSVPFDCYCNAAVFDVPGDRHVAQRNVNIVKMGEESLSFGFHVVNPLPIEGAFQLRTTEVRPRRKLELMRQAIGCGYAQIEQLSVAGFGLDIGKILPPNREAGQEKEFPTGRLVRSRSLPRQKNTSLEMKKGELRHAVLTVARNSDIRPGDLNIIQIEQIDNRTKQTVGGLWIVVQY